MATDRISGRLVSTYALDVPSDPGWSQPDRHRADGPGGGVDRDDAPAGGGWQPYGWDTGVSVLPGSTYGVAPTHTGDGSHRGDQGRGSGRPDVDLVSTDRKVSGDGPAPLLGAAGAANGGLSATGVSAPWASPPVARRRADGGTVVRAGGLRLGRDYTHPYDEHRQGLHFNRPTLRFVRLARPQVSTEPSLRTAGPVAPRSRTILRPYGQTDETIEYADAGPVDAGPIGGDWAR